MYALNQACTWPLSNVCMDGCMYYAVWSNAHGGMRTTPHACSRPAHIACVGLCVRIYAVYASGAIGRVFISSVPSAC
jgi:hypothetical protein